MALLLAAWPAGKLYNFSNLYLSFLDFREGKTDIKSVKTTNVVADTLNSVLNSFSLLVFSY